MLESLTVLLNVEDVPAALAFFNELFGFEKEQEYEEGGVIRWVSLRMGQTLSLIHI